MKFILALVLSIVVALFAIQNSKPVEVTIFFNTFEVSQALVILLSTALGAIIAFSLGLVKQLALSKNLKDRNKSIKQLEYELTTTKTKLAETETKLSEQSQMVQGNPLGPGIAPNGSENPAPNASTENQTI